MAHLMSVRYVKRRAKEEFHKHAGESDAGKLQHFWTKAQSDFDLVRRQATVYTLFGRKHKSIMVRFDAWLRRWKWHGGFAMCLQAMQDVKACQVVYLQTCH